MSFQYLEQWSKTPMDLGLPVEELDPLWERAMFTMKKAIEEERGNSFNESERPHG